MTPPDPARGHPYMLAERKAAMGEIVHELYQALCHLRKARHLNHLNALDIDLISERPLVDLINATVQTYQQSNAVPTHQEGNQP